MPWRFVPNTCITSRLVQSVLGFSMVTFTRKVHQEPCQLHHEEEEEELCAHCWFVWAPSLFQLLQGRQCLFKVRSALHWHRIGTCLVRTKPPITFVMVIFLWGQMVSMIFVRKSIHLSTRIFVSTIFNLSIAECFISYESLMDNPGRTSSCTSSSAGWPWNNSMSPGFLTYRCP